MRNMKNYLTLKEIGKGSIDQVAYNDNLHHFIGELVGYSAEFISSELDELHDCKSMVMDMNLDCKQENIHLERIYLAMVRQYKIDIKLAETLSKTNEIIDLYNDYSLGMNCKTSITDES